MTGMDWEEEGEEGETGSFEGSDDDNNGSGDSEESGQEDSTDEESASQSSNNGTGSRCPPSKPPKEKLRQIKQRKPYVRRWGLLGLSMTANYGKKSGWGCRAGVRELIQNLYAPKGLFS
jgi:hypothetical protein